MKTLSLYQSEGKVIFDLEKVYENLWAPLSNLQESKIGFVPLFFPEEGEQPTYFTTEIEGYVIFNVKQTKRKVVKPETTEYEFNARIKKMSSQEIIFDMDQVLNEVNQDLIRMSEQTSKEYLTVFDVANNRFMIDASRNAAEDVMQLLHKLFVESCTFNVVMSDPSYMQKLMTGYVLKESSIPEPFVLGEYTELGLPATVGEKAKPSKVIVKDEHCACEEVKKHLANNKRINKLELDFDAVIFFNIDSTFFINKLSFQETLAIQNNEDVSEEDNFIATNTVRLPEISRMVNILVRDLSDAENKE